MFLATSERSRNSPWSRGNLLDRLSHFHRFHGQSQETVSQYYHRISIFISQLESQYCKVHHFLDGSRSQINKPVIAMPAPLNRLKIVTLSAADIAQSGDRFSLR